MKKKEGRTAQDVQDEIFRKMPAEKKIKLTADVSVFCLKLNQLNEYRKPGKTTL